MQKSVKIIGREQEIENLERIMQSNQVAFLAVYGRRRVGKTFLIRQYLKDSLVFDFTGTKDGTTKQQLNNFFSEYLKRTAGKNETQPPSSWQEAFQYLAAYLNDLPKKKSKQMFFWMKCPGWIFLNQGLYRHWSFSGTSMYPI